MKKALLVLLCLLLLPLAALAEDDHGILYTEFQASYSQNITFINQNQDRYLLPFTPQVSFDSNGGRIYAVASGALMLQIKLDDEQRIIANCLIYLEAPDGLTYGTSEYNDFTVSGYHSYALIMSLSTAATAIERYELVNEISVGLSQSDVYEAQVGDYHLVCRRDGKRVSFDFQNSYLPDRLPDSDSTEDEIRDDDDLEEGEYVG